MDDKKTPWSDKSRIKKALDVSYLTFSYFDVLVEMLEIIESWILVQCCLGPVETGIKFL
jgi:hypothetical protein